MESFLLFQTLVIMIMIILIITSIINNVLSCSIYHSFISKVLTMILNQRTTVFLDYIRKREGFMDSFLKHLGTSAIMDLLLQMIVANDGDQNKLDLALVSSFLVLPLSI